MRLPRIDAAGFKRIAQAAPALRPVPSQPPAPEVDMAQMQRDIDTLRQWIDYFNETNILTQQELDALKSEIDMLEDYITTPETAPTEPTPAETGYMTDYDPSSLEDYFKSYPYPVTLY